MENSNIGLEGYFGHNSVGEMECSKIIDEVNLCRNWSSLIYNKSATRATQMRHKCNTSKTKDTSATWVKNFDFDSDKSINLFLHAYIYYMASEWLQGEEQFHSKN